MSQFVLTLLDAAGIQEYIFGSNVLRENLGASELVRRATRQWPFELLREHSKVNLKPDRVLHGLPDEIDEAHRIERDGLDAEVVYAGGGNGVILFARLEQAKEFITALNLRILAEAPGLELVAHHVVFEWDAPFMDILSSALAGLAAKKLDRQASMPVMGIGTTAACQSTGWPAVGTDADEPDLKPKAARPRLLSANVLAKLAVVEDANNTLKRLLPFRHDGADFSVPYDFDNFGREHSEISYIAVAHADGNGLGGRIQDLRQALQGRPARECIQAMRVFSGAIEVASQKALQQLGERLLDYWEIDPEDGDLIVERLVNEDGVPVEVGRIVLDQDQRWKRPYIPFRPIVFGGDDLTFVCDGRLGLGLIAAYLEYFAQAVQNQVQRLASTAPQASNALNGFTASGGVAVVKTHYPFARAYALADNLRSQAKHLGAAFDWHFAATGLFGDITELRERQYRVPAGYLEMRPVVVESASGTWQTWPTFVHVTRQFASGNQWKDKHNKVIALRQALRDGPLAVSKFRSAYELPALPEITSTDLALQTTGWTEQPVEKTQRRCGYFDAIEALDFFMPLIKREG